MVVVDGLTDGLELVEIIVPPVVLLVQLYVLNNTAEPPIFMDWPAQIAVFGIIEAPARGLINTTEPDEVALAVPFFTVT